MAPSLFCIGDIVSELIKVSHSKLNTWTRCRRKFAFKYHDGWQSKQKAMGLSVGSFVHQFLEAYYKGEFRDGNALGLWVADNVDIKSEEDMESMAASLRMTKKYIDDFAAFNDREWEPIEVEVKKEVDFTSPGGVEYTLVFIPDTLMRNTKTGKIWLWDHKTHKSNPISELQAQLDVQFPTYIAGLRQQGIDVYGCVFNMLNTYQYKDYPGTPVDKLFKRLQTYRTPAEIDRCVYLTGLKVDDMVANEEHIYHNFTRDCSWCEFAEVCLTEVKGFDILPVLEAGFERR